MKILNEANLVYFSTCPSHTTKEGWLLKRGDVNKHFHKRWFVLKGNLLFYFEKPGDKEPSGVIILEGYTVELAPNPGSVENFTFMIVFSGSTNTRRYILQAESQQVMEEWMRVITCASYDYMKIMVAELKAQLDDLTSQDLSKELEFCRKEISAGQRGANKAPMQNIEVKVPETSASPQSQRKARPNPFDSHKSSELDAFGQKPFVPVLNTVPAASKQEAHESAKPAVRKKLRKKLHKHLHHHSKRKEFHDTKDAPTQPTQFYTDATSFYPPEKLKVKTESRFMNLHNKYGQMIQHVLANSNSFSNDSTSTDDGSSNGSLSDSEKTMSTEEKLIDL